MKNFNQYFLTNAAIHKMILAFWKNNNYWKVAHLNRFPTINQHNNKSIMSRIKFGLLCLRTRDFKTPKSNITLPVQTLESPFIFLFVYIVIDYHSYVNANQSKLSRKKTNRHYTIHKISSYHLNTKPTMTQ